MLQVTWTNIQGIVCKLNFTNPMLGINYAEQYRKAGFDVLVFVK